MKKTISLILVSGLLLTGCSSAPVASDSPVVEEVEEVLEEKVDTGKTSNTSKATKPEPSLFEVSKNKKYFSGTRKEAQEAIFPFLQAAYNPKRSSVDDEDIYIDVTSDATGLTGRIQFNENSDGNFNNVTAVCDVFDGSDDDVLADYSKDWLLNMSIAVLTAMGVKHPTTMASEAIDNLELVDESTEDIAGMAGESTSDGLTLTYGAIFMGSSTLLTFSVNPANSTSDD